MLFASDAEEIPKNSNPAIKSGPTRLLLLEKKRPARSPGTLALDPPVDPAEYLLDGGHYPPRLVVC